jgi:4-carboxymuconolactone decarboxylase
MFDDGLKVRKEVLGAEYVDNVLTNASDFTRPFQEFVTERVWGSVWLDDTLDRRTRSLLTLGMVAAMGQLEEVKLHAAGALRNGCSVEEVSAALQHLALYAGVARAVAAFGAADEVIRAKGSDL